MLKASNSPASPFRALLHSRVSLTNRTGDHIRYVPAAFAGALVAGGTAVTAPAAGKVRAITLTETAATHAVRIGDPTGSSLGVRFYRWEHLDGCAGRIVQHHPRCTYEDLCR